LVDSLIPCTKTEAKNMGRRRSTTRTHPGARFGQGRRREDWQAPGLGEIHSARELGG